MGYSRNFLISTFCNHTIFGDDVVFRFIICINYADNILFMHHIYNVQKIKVSQTLICIINQNLFATTATISFTMRDSA